MRADLAHYNYAFDVFMCVRSVCIFDTNQLVGGLLHVDVLRNYLYKFSFEGSRIRAFIHKFKTHNQNTVIQVAKANE